MKKALIEKYVARLDAISGADPEGAHGDADSILLEALPIEIQKAYERVVNRCSWWAYA